MNKRDNQIGAEEVSIRPTRDEAEQAVRTLIRWAGDDPEREGLIQTPARVARAYREFFSGYDSDPMQILATTFSEVDGYDEMVVLKDIRFESYCEHHMVPIIGRAHVAYLPEHRVVGISKLARLVDVYAKRLQIQEKMTVQIADALNTVLQPKGVAVILEAAHQCMMDNLAEPKAGTMFPHLREGLLLSALLPDARLDWIAADDVGALAGSALNDPQRWHGETVPLASERLTMSEVANRLGNVLGAQINVLHVSPDEARAKGLAPGWVNAQEWINAVGYRVDIDSLSKRGVKLTPMVDWIDANRQHIVLA